jgi:hypothetical protein
MNSFPLILSSLCVIRFFSCEGGSNAPQSVNADNLPLSVGSAWTYAIYDSVRHVADTVTVTVVDSTLLSNGSTAMIFQYAYTHSLESQYVVRSGDSVLVYRSPEIGTLSMIYILPFEVGRQWTSYTPASMKVTAMDRVSVPAGSFDRTFRIEHHPNIGNFYGGTTFWFAPNVGLVRLRRSWIDTIAENRVNTVWELISYQPASGKTVAK